MADLHPEETDVKCQAPIQYAAEKQGESVRAIWLAGWQAAVNHLVLPGPVNPREHHNHQGFCQQDNAQGHSASESNPLKSLQPSAI